MSNNHLLDGRVVLVVGGTGGVGAGVARLVNSAGLTSRGTLVDTTPELFDAHVAVNLRGPSFTMPAAVAFLLSERSGVVTGSVLDWDQNVQGCHD